MSLVQHSLSPKSTSTGFPHHYKMDKVKLPGVNSILQEDSTCSASTMSEAPHHHHHHQCYTNRIVEHSQKSNCQYVAQVQMAIPQQQQAAAPAQASQFPPTALPSPIGYYHPSLPQTPTMPYTFEFSNVPYHYHHHQPTQPTSHMNIPPPPVYYIQTPYQEFGYLPQPQMPELIASLPKQAIAWSFEDDKLLRYLKEKKNLGWREISLYFPKRTPNACQFRWRRIVAGVVSPKASSIGTASKVLKKDLSTVRKKNIIKSTSL